MIERRLGEAESEAERDAEAAIRAVPGWVGPGGAGPGGVEREIRYRPVPGGISNPNWRVSVAGLEGEFFLKVPGRGTEMFIDRAAAAEASRAAERLGIGPPVVHFDPATGVEVHRFLEGRRSCTNGDFYDPGIRRAAITAYRRFNDGPPLGLTKTVFDMIEEHFEQVRQLGGRWPEDSAWLQRRYREARAALEAAGLDLVPCFNDPMAGNFLLDPEARDIVLVDYEYASNNDRCYELGIWFGEMFFPEEVELELVEAYFGRVEPAILARIYLHKALADVKWSTWAMVQQQVSTLDFDFYKYGAWKQMRARWLMRSPRWAQSLHRL